MARALRVVQRGKCQASSCLLYSRRMPNDYDSALSSFARTPKVSLAIVFAAESNYSSETHPFTIMFWGL